MAVLTLAEFDTLEVECPDLQGIACHAKILSLAYQLSICSDYFVSKIDDFTNYVNGETHPMYEIRHLDTDQRHYLLVNKGWSEYLLGGYRTVDYILASPSAATDTATLIKLIKESNGVSISFSIDSLPDSEKLLFEPLL